MACLDSSSILEDAASRLRRRNQINNERTKIDREGRARERKVKADRVEKSKVKRSQVIKITSTQPSKSKKPSTESIMALKSGKRSRGALEEGEIPEEDQHVPKRRSTRRLVRTSISSPPPAVPSFTNSAPVSHHSPVTSANTAESGLKRKRGSEASDSLEKMRESKYTKLSAPSRPEIKPSSIEVKPPVADDARAGGDQPTAASGAELSPPKPKADTPADGGDVVKEKPHKALSSAPRNGAKRKADEEADEPRPSKARRTLGVAVPKQKKIADGIKIGPSPLRQDITAEIESSTEHASPPPQAPLNIPTQPDKKYTYKVMTTRTLEGYFTVSLMAASPHVEDFSKKSAPSHRNLAIYKVVADMPIDNTLDELVSQGVAEKWAPAVVPHQRLADLRTGKQRKVLRCSKSSKSTKTISSGQAKATL